MTISQFVKMMQIQKLNNGYQNEQDLIEAFQALGGNEDKSGSVATSKLKGICDDFELSIDIGELVALYDSDNSGFIDYEEFAAMLKDDAGDDKK
jgi:Ca2+-binding EF-hand superfamily protein